MISTLSRNVSTILYDRPYYLFKVVNTVFQEFSLPKFYNPPKFHVSLAWCLGDRTKELNAILPALGLYFNIYNRE